jgi:RHS repeat-associated protein
VDQLFADEQISPSASTREGQGEGVSLPTQPGTVLWALTDNQNTVRDLAQFNPQTGTTSVVDHREYNSYGVLVSQTNSSIVCIIGYTGRPFDQNTGLQNNLNRWSTDCGWWLSQDPDGFGAGQTNLYGYCGNSPVNGVDPTGTDTLTIDYSKVQRYPAAGGSVNEPDGTAMDVWVAGNVFLVNEQKQRSTPLMQCGCQGRDATKSQWLQFYQTNEYDNSGNLVVGSGSRVGDMFVFDGQWYLDAPPPPANGNADPNAIFYDYPGNKNVCIRTADHVSIYDRPSEANLEPNISKVVTSYQTYFVCNGTVQWEFTWDFVATKNADGTVSFSITNVTGKAVTEFGNTVKTQNWVVGNMLETVEANKVKIGNPISYKNPFFRPQ